MALLSVSNLSLSFGEAPLLENAGLQIERGERVCLLGRNGAGKSSLMKVLAGEIAPDGGDVAVQKGAKVARLPQEVPPSVAGTVREIIRGDSGAEEFEIDSLLSRLDLEGEADFASLSGGLKRRAWLGRVLATDPDVLLLDEPTNHLDIASIQWLEEFLARHVKTLVFVTHDRAFLKRLATRIVEIDRGRLLSWECDYDTYLVRKEAALEAEAKQNALFDKRLGQEEAWIRRGVEARRTKSQARIRDLMDMRVQRQERRNKLGTVQLRAQDAQKSGRLVAELENVNFSYPGEEATSPIVSDFSTVIARGDKIGVIGANGSGKTTLLKLLLGQLQPQSGEVNLGTNLQLAYFDQLRNSLDEEMTVQQNVSGDNDTIEFNGERRHVVGYLQEFLFAPTRIRTPVKLLSGGERNRLLLAKLFTRPANVLVLDEPTNDLDIETLDVLEELLVEFQGTVLMVSHDRAFLNDVATSIIAFEPNEGGEGYRIGEYMGGYDDFERVRLQNEKAEASRAPVKTAAPAATTPTAPTKRRLSWKETRELEELPGRIEKLEAEQKQLGETLSDPIFYQSGDHVKAASMASRLDTVESELLTAYERWDSLMELQA